MEMKLVTVKSRPLPRIDIDAACDLIVRTQKPSGEIPWSIGDKTDPWDMVESAIGLNVGGYRREARMAFRWMKDHQLDDGAWYSAYRDGVPEDKTRDTNMSTYIAVGVYHDYLINKDKDFLEEMWPTIDRAMEFARGFQAPGGEIYWATSPDGVLDPMALLTGSSSVHMSLKCALAIAGELGKERPGWRACRRLLVDAIRNRPHHFNMAKNRFSMDWFYPILAGALTGQDAQRRLEKYWDRYVVKGQGVLCVSDQPWVTVAETSEFVLALSAMGNENQARIVYNWITDRTFEDGSYWCGFTYPDMIVWPEDKITWTNAVVIMAADALYGLTPAGQIFSHKFWMQPDLADLL